MHIRRLGWAGIEVLAQGQSVVVDYVRKSAPLLTRALPAGSLVPTLHTPALAALVTHLHADHTDVGAIESAVGAGGVVLRPAPFEGTPAEAVWTAQQEQALDASSLEVRIVSEWDRMQLGPYTITAVPAVDGLGDPQVNWVIEAEGVRVFHGGDTMFHGYWWLIAGRLGPIDVAALPINGAVVDFPHQQPPSTLPAAMTPDQAVRAATILKAKMLLPIHFGVDEPPMYAEDGEPLVRLRVAADLAAQRVVDLDPGRALDVSAAANSLMH
ncbi:MBL fold metallo-hydrolase [Rhodococcoides yunnanense]|uniref:MBL fold metallo-hydrolase n=1 Tax=Rhodococcoides yunnanense TaxID=278209 RepID=UPI0009347B64|nr:MBL fold metallo-hydrolase [Rhodococcus yunnanensis]